MAIRIEHLNKHIGKQHVLKDVNLTIGDGEVIGLLGPNGAGKSTLMKIMVGVWDATSGEVQVPKSVGFLPEQNPLYEDMYVREYLRFFVELRTPKPLLLHSTPYTLHPTPYTLHPTPYTLHPTPTSRRPHQPSGTNCRSQQKDRATQQRLSPTCRFGASHDW